MALTSASSAMAEVPEAFSSAIEAYGLGRLSLSEVRETLARTLERAPASAEAIHELLDEELRARTLSIADYGELVGLVGSVVSENVPTECSEETPAESGVYRVVEEGTLVRNEGDWPAIEEPDPDDATRPFNTDGDAADDDALDDMAAGVELPAAGDVLRDRFRLEQEVARGAMGIVFKATDLLKLEANASDPLVAVKLVSPDLAENTAALRAFHIEVASTQHLSHPNIIHVFELDRDGEQHFITMEWLEGESLADRLDRQGDERLPIEFADAVITQLCDALVYAHEHNVVHADVKPGNVFVLESEEIKLIDFGIAQAEAAEHSQALTPAYASCERLEREKPEARDDLFSLACLIYRLLAGRRPFGPLTALEAEAQGVEPLPISGMDAWRWDALSRALSFRREDRQRNVREFVAEYCAAPEVARVDEAFDTNSLPIIDTVSDAGREAAPGLKPGMQVDVVFDESAQEFQETDAAVIFESALAEQADAEARAADDHDAEADAAEPVPAATSQVPPEVAPAQTTAQRGLPPRLRFGLAAGVTLAVIAGFIFMTAGPDTPPVASSQEPVAVLPSADIPTGKEVAESVATATAPEPEAAPDETPATFEPEATAVVAAPAGVVAAEVAPAVDASPAADAVSAEQAATEELAAEEAVPQEDTATEELVAEEALAESDVAEPAADTESEQVAMAAAAAPASVPDFAVAGFVAADVGDLAIETGSVFDPREPVQLSELEFVDYVEPRSPRMGGQRTYDGWVDVEFRVGTDGVTRSIEVTGSSLSSRFETAAANAVKKWRFEPFVYDGEPVAVYTAVRLRFTN